MDVDVVIVGAGSAGVTLGTRLSEDPARSVLLVEAGPDFAPGDPAHDLSTVSFALTDADWALRAEVTADRTLDYPQGKCVGGGSSVNGALAFRGAPEDFDGWKSGGCPSWGWEQMLGPFCRLEHDVDYGTTSPVHGGEGPVPVVRWSTGQLTEVQVAFRESCLAEGLPWTDDHNSPSSTGVGVLPMNRSGKRRMSTAVTYLASARSRPNLQLWSGTRVLRIEIERGRATGVTVDRHGVVETVTAGEVVLSGGSLQSPALLWRSGVGPADRLSALGIGPVVDLPAVGANLHDHPGVFLFHAPGRRRSPFSEPQYQLGARYDSAGSTVPNDMFLSMMSYWDLSGSPDFQELLGMESVVVLTCGVHQPESRGEVTLTSANPAVPPAVRLNLLADRRDTDRLVEGVRRCAAVAGQEAMADFVGERLLFDGDLDDDAAVAGYVRAVVAPWYHPVGTCRMGPAGPETVVGDNLRVHGVDRLRVVDASIMPAIVRSPPNLTTIAIGERAAQLMTAGD
jgi:choline dehydrogenase